MKSAPINTVFSQFPEYIFARLAKEIKAVEARTGRKVLNLGPGSPDVKPSLMYVEFLKNSLTAPQAHMYPGYGATKEFSTALLDWYQKRFGVTLNISQIMPLLGAKDGVSHLPLALLNPGDQVLLPNPGYPAYITPTILAGAVPITYDLLPENEFRVDLGAIGKLVSKKTKYMWVNFPGNPTGQVATLAELTMIVDFCRKRNILLIYDNAYSEITFDGFRAPSILQVPGALDVAVEIGSFSKSFSFAGLRMGWMVGNEQVVASLSKLKSHFDSGLSLPLQSLGAFALTHPDDSWRVNMLSDYSRRRGVLAALLPKLSLTLTKPKGSLYLWARIPDTSTNSTDFCLDLLQEKQILMTPGSAFGTNGERYVRASICSDISSIHNYFGVV